MNRPHNEIRNDMKLLQEIQAFLDAEQPEKAFDLVRSTGSRSTALLNALGVCLMRMGQIEKASVTFRNLVVSGTGFGINQDTPTVFQVNYATALLLGKHVDGCLAVLTQIDDQSHPAVVRLRHAVQQWKRTLGWVRRMLVPLLGLPDATVPLDFAPGELWIKGPGGPRQRAA